MLWKMSNLCFGFVVFCRLWQAGSRDGRHVSHFGICKTTINKCALCKSQYVIATFILFKIFSCHPNPKDYRAEYHQFCFCKNADLIFRGGGRNLEQSHFEKVKITLYLSFLINITLALNLLLGHCLSCWVNSLPCLPNICIKMKNGY